MLVRMQREGNPPTLLVGMEAGAATLENSMEVPQKVEIRGVPGWLSGLEPLPLAQVMIPGSWDRAPHWALCLAGSLLPPLSLPASLPTCDLCLSNK